MLLSALQLDSLMVAHVNRSDLSEISHIGSERNRS